MPSAEALASDHHDLHSCLLQSKAAEVSPAIIGKRTSLSHAGRREIQSLMKREPKKFLFVLCWTWLSIVAAALLAEYAQNPTLTVLAVLFIGTRQNVLAVLMHEQVHRLAFRGKAGDALCELAIAYPLLITLRDYRRVHLAHHQNYGTDRDPDYMRKRGLEWSFPRSKWELTKALVRDLIGLNAWALIRSKKATSSNPPEESSWPRAAFYIVVIIAVTALNAWRPVVVYWLLPLLTVMQAIVRWAAICEHKYNLDNPAVEESTPLIRLRWWEALIFPNLNFTTYHIYHHRYPQVPWANLPRVHGVYEREGLVDDDKVFVGFAQYLGHLTRCTAHRAPTKARHQTPESSN